MKPIFAAIALFAASVIADNFQINTPTQVDECEPTLLSWSGGQSPYYLSILPGSNPSGQALESFPTLNTTSITWQCNIQSGTSIGFTVRDSNGNIAQSAAVTVNPGSGDSCLTTTSFSPGSTGASSASATASRSATSAASSASTTAASSASSTASASASPSTSSGSSSGAATNTVQLGAAAIVGVAVAAFFL